MLVLLTDGSSFGLVYAFEPMTPDVANQQIANIFVQAGDQLAAGDLIGNLVKQLGADAYRDRQSAEQALKGAGPTAVPYLKKALASPDPEIRIRARRVLVSLGVLKEARMEIDTVMTLL